MAFPSTEQCAQPLGPPNSVGCQIAEASEAPRRKDAAAGRVVEQHLALLEVEFGQRAQQQRLAGARGPAQRDALAGGQLEGGRFQAGTSKVSDGEHGGGRLRHRNAAVPPLTWLRERPSRSEEHTSELQSLMRISYAGF